MARTGLVYDSRMLLHDTGPGHPERSARLDTVHQAIESANLGLTSLPFSLADRKELLRVHTAVHVDAIERVCASHGVYPDPDTSMVPASWDAARLAVGGVIAACKAVLDKTVDNAFCAVRPPGHHAESDQAMGFCLFNNVAIAARWLQQEAGIKRVAILDWDVHHGNGTQHSFYDDASVYYVSLHQHPLYPGTGRAHERGKHNTTLNIPLAPRTPAEVWIDAVAKRVKPELERFQPEFLLLSAGFDAHRDDPLSSQSLEPAHFAEMSRLMDGIANGRIVSALEGGYNLPALGESVIAHVRALRQL